MNKKILGTGLLVAVLSVAGFAHGGNMDQDSDGGMMMQRQGMMNQRGAMYNQNRQGQMNQRGMMMKGQGMMGKHMMMGQMMNSKRGMMGMFQNLNLNSDQKYKISILRDEMRLDMKKLMGPNHRKEMFKYVTTNGFDKAGFKKESSQMHDKMLDMRANNMEKMFKILTKEQITQLKKNIAN